jgi:competence protein ComEC
MNIRRPLSFIFLAFVLGIGFNYIISPPKFFLILGGVVCIIILLIHWASNQSFLSLNHDYAKHIILLAILPVSFNIGGLMCQHEMDKTDSLQRHIGSTVTFRGTGITLQSKDVDFYKLTVSNGSFNYLVHIYGSKKTQKNTYNKSRDGEHPNKIRPENLIGSTIIFKGEVEEPSPRRNPGCFDYQLYLKSVNVRSIVKCDANNITVVKPVFREEPINWLYSRLANLKYYFLDKIKPLMSDESFGLFNGMLFGSKDDMNEDMYEVFQRNGIAHILSVSGIHVGIVYSFIYMLFRKRLNKFTVTFIFMFLFVYMVLSEFSPSVIRAVIMICMHVIAKVLHRPYDLLTTGAFSAFIMLLLNPLTLFHVGFQLSFLAIFLLSFGIPYFKRYVGRKKILGLYKERFKSTDDLGRVDGLLVNLRWSREKAVEALLPLLVIQLGMATFSIFIFNYFSPVGLILNIPIIFISGLIIPVGMCLIPVSLLDIGVLDDFLIGAGAGFLDMILLLMVKINLLVGSLEFSSVSLVSPPPWLVLMFYGILFFVTSETFRILRSRRVNAWLVGCITIITIMSIVGSFTQALSRDNSDMVFVDVGQGDCIHVRTESGQNILIDGGGSANYDVGKKTLLPYLLKNGVSHLDYVIVTHLHTDHFKGIQELSKYMDIGKLVTFGDGNRPNNSMGGSNAITNDSDIEEHNIVYVGKGDRFNIEKNIYVDILHPDIKDMSGKDIGNAGSSLPLASGEDDENSKSLLLKLNYRGISALITGDIDEDGEQQIIGNLNNPEESLKSHILKVGHHGSKYSTSDNFLKYVDPKVAVIQVGKNNYGHPAPEVIEKLKNKDIMIFRNDHNGAVMLDIEEDSNVAIDRMIER